MTRKLSYEELETRLGRLEKQNTLLLFYLHDMEITVPPIPSYFVFSDDAKHLAQMFRPTSGHGGYVVFRQPRTQACATIVYLDEIDAKWPAELRILADRLRVIRSRELDKEAQLTLS